MRSEAIKKIVDFVNEQGTLIQEDGFDQVIAHHVCDSDILYISNDFVYLKDGSKVSLIDCSDNEIETVLNILSI